MMTRGKPKSKETCIRTCIVSGEKRHKNELIKFSINPQDVVVPDILGKLPGRGLWLYCTRNNLEKAIERNMFNRAARQRVEIPDDLLYKVEGGLVERLIGLLAIARKSGLLVAGFEQVKTEIRTQKVSLLFHGSDGSKRQLSKLLPAETQLPLIRCLSSAELGKIFGRGLVMNLGVRSNGLVETIRLVSNRLTLFRNSL